MNNCPSCGKPLITVERQGAPYVILDDYPTVNKMGHVIKPGTGDMWSVVMQEFAKAGANTYAFCKSTVWLHPKGPKKTKLEKEVYAKCENHFMQELMALMENKRGLFLLGAGATKLVTGLKVSEWSGLNVQPLYFNAPVVICSEKPGQTIGELRLAVTRFVKQTKL